MEKRSFTTPVKPGESVTIEGQGLTQASEIWFRALATRAEKRADVKATVTGVTASGITFTAPMVFGQQTVLLKEAGKEYTLGEMTFEEESGGEEMAILPKKVMKIVVLEDGNARSAATYTYKYDNATVAEINYFTENDNYICKYKDGKVSIAGTLNGSIEIKDGKAVKMITADDFIFEENTFSYTLDTWTILRRNGRKREIPIQERKHLVWSMVVLLLTGRGKTAKR